MKFIPQQQPIVGKNLAMPSMSLEQFQSKSQSVNTVYLENKVLEDSVQAAVHYLYFDLRFGFSFQVVPFGLWQQQQQQQQQQQHLNEVSTEIHKSLYKTLISIHEGPSDEVLVTCKTWTKTELKLQPTYEATKCKGTTSSQASIKNGFST